MAPLTMAPITRAIPTKVCRRGPLRGCSPLARIAGRRPPAHYAAAAIAREHAAASDWGRHGRTTTSLAAGAGGATGSAPCHAGAEWRGERAWSRLRDPRRVIRRRPYNPNPSPITLALALALALTPNPNPNQVLR